MTINESLLSTPTPITQSNDATCVSTIPAAQLQCAARILPLSKAITHRVSVAFHSSFGSGSLDGSEHWFTLAVHELLLFKNGLKLDSTNRFYYDSLITKGVHKHLLHPASQYRLL